MERRAGAALETMEVAHLAEPHRQPPVVRRVAAAADRARPGAQPRALVLDEPTNSLDLRACRDLTASLRRLAQAGTNIILVTHHLPDIIPEIGRVVALKDGRVFRDGPTAEVLTGRVLSEVFGVPVDVDRARRHLRRRYRGDRAQPVRPKPRTRMSTATSSSDSSRSAAPTIPSS